MNLSRPEEALADPVALAVLVALARAGGDLSPAAVADAAGHPAEAVSGCVQALLGTGLVLGQAGHLRLNHDHVLAMAVEQMAGARGRVLDRLRMHLGTWEPAPVWAAVAGSVGRGDAGHDDIDLLMVAPDGSGEDPRWGSQVAAIRADAEAWTGNPLHLIVLEAPAPAGRGGMVVLLGPA